MKKVKKIPELRFPEFDGEWEEKKLGEIGSIIGGGTPDTGNAKYWGGEIQWFTPTEIKSKYVKNSVRTLTQEGVNNSSAKILPEGTLLISSRATVGDISIALKECTTNQGFQSIVVNQENNNEFIYYWVLKNKKEFVNRASGSTFLEIPKREIEKISIQLPSLPEQTKIANFLSAIDKKIDLLSEKRRLLEEYKKGVMQQLFSQKIRFKDENGNNYPEWEEKKLGDVFSFINTNSFSRSLLNYEKGTIKNIHYGDIHTKFKSNFDIEKEEVPFINEDVNLSKISQENYCQVGDLIIADASEDHKDIGKAIEIINLGNQKLLAGLHTYIARDTQNLTATGFKGYMMQTYKVRLQIMELATGVSVLGISKGNLANVLIPLPCLAEQTKIANFLMSLDRQIELTGEQLDQTKTYKKGLLQKMFV